MTSHISELGTRITETLDVSTSKRLGEVCVLRHRVRDLQSRYASPGLTNLWHAAFTAIPLFISFADQRLYIVNNICVCVCVCVYIYIYIYTHTHTNTHTHIHISTAYRLYMNYRCYQMAVHKLERCEVLAGYLSLGRRTAGAWTNT